MKQIVENPIAEIGWGSQSRISGPITHFLKQISNC